MADMIDVDRLTRDHALLSRALFTLIVLLAISTSGLAFGQLSGAIAYRGFPGKLAWGAPLVCLVFAWSTRKRVHNGREASPALRELVSERATALRLSPPNSIVDATASDASIKYFRWRASLVVSPAMDILARVDRKRLGGIIAHELAHLAAGDAWKAAMARQSVRIAVALVLLDVLMQMVNRVMAWYDWTKATSWQWVREEEFIATFRSISAATAGAVALMMAYAAFMRMREFEADRVAAALGDIPPLRSLAPGKTPRVWAWVALHPSTFRRATAAESPSQEPIVDSLTMALLVCTGYLLIDALAGVPGEMAVLGGVAIIFAQIAISWLGYYLGRGLSSRDRATQFRLIARVVPSVLCGVAAATLFTRGVAGYESQAPAKDQLWEILLPALLFSCATTAAIMTSCTIGMAAAFNGGDRSGSRIAWLIVASVFATLSLLLVIPVFILDPWGAPLQDSLWRLIRDLADDARSNAFVPDFDPDKIPISVMEFLACYVLGATAYIAAIFFCALIARGVGKRWPLPDGRGARIRGTLIAFAFLATVAFVCIGAAAPISSIGAEIRWKDSIWLECIDARKTADHDQLFRLTQRLYTEAGKVLSQERSAFGRAYVALASSGCAGQHDGYPLLRKLVAYVAPLHDSEITINVDDHYVTIFFRDDETPVHTIYRSSSWVLEADASEMVTQIVRAISPYRYAWMVTNSMQGAADQKDEILLAATATGPAHERAAAHSTYGLRRLTIDHDLIEADAHLKRAVLLWPDQPVIAANYALVILSADQRRCQEAEHWVGVGHWQLSAEAVGQWGRCLYLNGRGDEAIQFMWRSRGAQSKRATFEAVLGEIALDMGRLDLARRHLDAAMDLSPNEPPACARVLQAFMKDPSKCTLRACPAPLNDLNSYEKECWKSWAARYGHA